MSVKYYEIKSHLREQIGLVDSIMYKILKYILLYSALVVFICIGSGSTEAQTTRYLLSLVVIGIVYRFNVLFERVSIKNLAIEFKKNAFLNGEQTENLISEIELSLNKVNNFANWSCGILATISIFAVTTFINFFKEAMTKEEINSLLVGNHFVLQDSLIGVLGQLILLVLSALFGYYLTVQAFTYDRRFVSTVLKSSIYIDEGDMTIKGFWKKFWYSLEHFTSGV